MFTTISLIGIEEAAGDDCILVRGWGRLLILIGVHVVAVTRLNGH